jgi:hypothetical protein
MSQTVNRVGYTSRLKVPRLAYLWATRVAHSNHRWRPSLVSLGFVSSRSFQRYRWYHHWSFCVSPGSFSLFPFSSLFPLFLFNLVSNNFIIWDSHMSHLQLANCRYHLQLSKLCYFLKYFLQCYFIIFLLCWNPKELL